MKSNGGDTGGQSAEREIHEKPDESQGSVEMEQTNKPTQPEKKVQPREPEDPTQPREAIQHGEPEDPTQSQDSIQPREFEMHMQTGNPSNKDDKQDEKPKDSVGDPVSHITKTTPEKTNQKTDPSHFEFTVVNNPPNNPFGPANTKPPTPANHPTHTNSFTPANKPKTNPLPTDNPTETDTKSMTLTEVNREDIVELSDDNEEEEWGDLDDTSKKSDLHRVGKKVQRLLKRKAALAQKLRIKKQKLTLMQNYLKQLTKDDENANDQIMTDTSEDEEGDEDEDVFAEDSHSDGEFNDEMEGTAENEKGGLVWNDLEADKIECLRENENAITSKENKPDHNNRWKDPLKSRLDGWNNVAKDLVPMSVFEEMVGYAMKTVGLNAEEYPVVAELTANYLKKTNTFEAKNWSSWSGSRRLKDETRKLRGMSPLYPHFVLTLAPDMLLCTIAIRDLIAKMEGSGGQALDVIRDHDQLHYLRAAIKTGEKLDWQGNSKDKLMIVGRRPDEETFAAKRNSPVKTKPSRLEVARRNTVVPSEATVKKKDHGLTAYPAPERLIHVPKVTVTPREWEEQNVTWLVKLKDRKADNESLVVLINKNVTAETMPIISEDWRNILYFWVEARHREFDRSLFDIPSRESICKDKTDVLDHFNLETDPTRKVIREIESTILESKPTKESWEKTVARIKKATDTLFAYRDCEIKNHELITVAMTKAEERIDMKADQMTKRFWQNEIARKQLNPTGVAMENGARELDEEMAYARGDVKPSMKLEEVLDLLDNVWDIDVLERGYWRDIVESSITAANRTGDPRHPDNFETDAILRLAQIRGGKALRILLEWHIEKRKTEDSIHRNDWYLKNLSKDDYDKWRNEHNDYVRQMTDPKTFEEWMQVQERKRTEKYPTE
ncbi:hypothetical protein F53441_7504 [Fusarium austroafricanum]|uniref:Uncharacterized protein n=1 Tax=Fusarium austroafricanum TaxID=2364996 RepID=A0A8H4KGA8_9HYPO|nr:hypothetical protein F53441_7504 [Fusarium austroafricanum]